MITLYGFGTIFPEGIGETKDLRAQWALEETGLPNQSLPSGTRDRRRRVRGGRIGPPHLDTEAWAHSCARAHETTISADAVVSAGRHAGRRFAELPDLFGPARCILDQGARIVRLDETGIAVEPATL